MKNDSIYSLNSGIRINPPCTFTDEEKAELKVLKAERELTQARAPNITLALGVFIGLPIVAAGLLLLGVALWHAAPFLLGVVALVGPFLLKVAGFILLSWILIAFSDSCRS
jgi:hypothetical protein